MFKHSVRSVLFREHPVVDITISNPGEFDITIYNEEMVPSFLSSGKFLQNQYCSCLLEKIFRLKKSEIKSFLQYQSDQLIDPLHWLQKLEKLIELNWEIFSTLKEERHFEKASSLISILIHHYETKPVSSGENKFDFFQLKRKLATYKSFSEKVSFLHEAKTEYLQNKPRLVDPQEVPFDEKIKLELDLLHTQQSLKEIQQQSGTNTTNNTSQKGIAKINCNLNQFVDIFYQLMNEKKVNGLPALETDTNTIAEIISSNFTDKTGNSISLDTVRTILKPSRIEKRPKGYARYNTHIEE